MLTVASTCAAAQHLVAGGSAMNAKMRPTSILWAGVHWEIPAPFFFGKRNAFTDVDEIFVEAGWDKSTGSFFPANVRRGLIELDAHMRRSNSADPRNALETIRRLHWPFEWVADFSGARLAGMSYLGSSEGAHFFLLGNEDAYISCRYDPVPPPALAASEPSARSLNCDTTFWLPHQIYAVVNTTGIKLDDIGPAFTAERRLLLSFIR